MIKIKNPNCDPFKEQNVEAIINEIVVPEVEENIIIIEAPIIEYH